MTRYRIKSPVIAVLAAGLILWVIAYLAAVGRPPRPLPPPPPATGPDPYSLKR